MKVLIKFIYIGIINTLFYYLLYCLLIWMGFNYIISVIGANSVGILFSFKTFGKYVFNNEDIRLIFRFLLVYGWNILLNLIIIKIFSGLINSLYVSGFIATIIVALNSFFLNKFYVYEKKKRYVNEN